MVDDLIGGESNRNRFREIQHQMNWKSKSYIGYGIAR